MRDFALLLLAALFGVASPLQAQRTTGGQAGLRATMTSFLRALPDERPLVQGGAQDERLMIHGPSITEGS